MSDTTVEAAPLRDAHADAEYDAYLARMTRRYLANTTNGAAPLFHTDAAGLWAAYLDTFGPRPADGEKAEPARQYHTCNACRHFVERFGDLVTIDENGMATPAFWHEEDAPEPYRPAVAAMARIVRRAKVTGVFLSPTVSLGTRETGEWHHLSLQLAVGRSVHASLAQTAGQAMAEKLEDFKNVWRALDEIPQAHIETALTLLRSDALYRSERVLGAAEWLYAVHTERAAAQGAARANIVWRRIATAPAGYAHPRSSMIGTLLEDIAAGMAYADVSRRFADKMKPTNYQRAQVAPTAGAIDAAEKLVEKLGVAPALPRRYARLAELPLLWTPPPAKVAGSGGGPIFGHLQPKVAPAEQAPQMAIPPTVMTWEKFQRTVLQTATAIDALVTPESHRLMALVTASNPDAPPILQWDRQDARNPVSWYYASGIDAEVKKRVTAAGGRYEDVDIRASLIWNNRNDLDLHVRTPREHLYFGNKHTRCGGWLDVDMNVRGETTTPIENIRWARGDAQTGTYTVWVENYRFHEPSRDGTPFRVELEINGEVFHFDGCTPRGRTSDESRIAVADIRYERGGQVTALGLQRAAEESSAWNVQPGTLTTVTGIALSPNLWGEHPMPQFGKHAFFLLAGCRDVGSGIGRGFFTETLRSELRPARATLEAYNATASIAGADEADACGIGMSADAPMDLVLRVTSALGQNFYKLDRWD